MAGASKTSILAPIFEDIHGGRIEDPRRSGYGVVKRFGPNLEKYYRENERDPGPARIKMQGIRPVVEFVESGGVTSQTIQPTAVTPLQRQSTTLAAGPATPKMITAEQLVNAEHEVEMVLVHASQPFAHNKELASRVLNNLCANTEYIYVMDQPRQVPALIRTLVGKDPKKTEHNLEVIREKVTIYIVKSLWPFDFSIQNPDIERECRCYLTAPGSYESEEWCKEKVAYRIVERLQDEIGAELSQPGIHWVRKHATTEAPEELNAMKETLWRDVNARFAKVMTPMVAEILRTICFGEDDQGPLSAKN
jgi:hypothetical protein